MRASRATPNACLHPALLPLLTRESLEGIAEAVIAELDRRDGDIDLEPEEEVSEFEYLCEADDCPPFDTPSLIVTNLFVGRWVEARHA